MTDDARQALIDRIDAVLPQTQCQQCGYAGCRPYAEAVAARHESINLCPPGGEATRRKLAEITARQLEPSAPVHAEQPLRVARIIEADCIGCTKCIQVCPVDAIIGCAGAMHTVVERWCTGCDLCAPVCPTDCIEMPRRTESAALAAIGRARSRYRQREQRLADGAKAGAAAVYVDLEGVRPEDIKDTVAEAVQRRRKLSSTRRKPLDP